VPEFGDARILFFLLLHQLLTKPIPTFMNYIDLVLGIILIIAAIQGFRKGFIVEAASLAALILGIWGAIKFPDWTVGYISKTFNYHSSSLGTIAFLVTFIGIVILIHILGKILDSTIKAVALGFLNRLAGIIFGVLKTAVILSILLMLFDPIDENVHLLPSKQKAESKTYSPMKQLVPTLFPFIKLWDSKDKSSPDPKSKDQKPESKTT
jgi:membrane protein required for colicin V production